VVQTDALFPPVHFREMGDPVSFSGSIHTDGQDEYLLRKHPYRWAG